MENTQVKYVSKRLKIVEVQQVKVLTDTVGLISLRFFLIYKS